jgi:hypothetical protein
VDLRHELLILHRSVAMLRPDERALTRDQALELFEIVAALQGELDRSWAGIRVQKPGWKLIRSRVRPCSDMLWAGVPLPAAVRWSGSQRVVQRQRPFNSLGEDQVSIPPDDSHRSTPGKEPGEAPCDR